MDTGLDENETELGVLVFAVALEMLANSDSLEEISVLPDAQILDLLTFLINMYRSSGISGASPN